MKRPLFQAYVKNSQEAVCLYQKVFHAGISSCYPNPDGTYYHCELDLDGAILAVSEQSEEDSTTGTVMQFCLHYTGEETDKVKHAYEMMKPGAKILHPLSACDYSTLMCDLIDCFGIRWCLFVE